MSKDSTIHIALAANHRYLPGLQVTLASMIRNASDKKSLLFHVFADGLTDEDCASLTELAARCGLPIPLSFHYPDISRIASRFSAYKSGHTAFLRLFLCEFLDCPWVIYSDVDTLWMHDVCRLWSFRDDSVSLVWAPDLPSIQRGVGEYSKPWFPDYDPSLYGCSGVMLMNLRKLRTDHLVEQSCAFVEQWGTPFFVDQDILNVLCQRNARMLPPEWDLLVPSRAATCAAVLHFNGLGAKFHESFSGWRILYAFWYRYYDEVVRGVPSHRLWGPCKAFIFWLCGRLYPRRSLIAFLCLPLAPRWTDQIQRSLFFAWLWYHARWWRHGHPTF